MKAEEIKNKTVQMRTGKVKMLRDKEYWSNSEREILKREYAEGTSINEIALMLNRSESAVYQQIERLRLCVRIASVQRKKSDGKKTDDCLCKYCTCDQSLCPLCIVYIRKSEVQ